MEKQGDLVREPVGGANPLDSREAGEALEVSFLAFREVAGREDQHRDLTGAALPEGLLPAIEPLSRRRHFRDDAVEAALI